MSSEIIAAAIVGAVISGFFLVLVAIIRITPDMIALIKPKKSDKAEKDKPSGL